MLMRGIVRQSWCCSGRACACQGGLLPAPGHAPAPYDPGRAVHGGAPAQQRAASAIAALEGAVAPARRSARHKGGRQVAPVGSEELGQAAGRRIKDPSQQVGACLCPSPEALVMGGIYGSTRYPVAVRRPGATAITGHNSWRYLKRRVSTPHPAAIAGCLQGRLWAWQQLHPCVGLWEWRHSGRRPCWTRWTRNARAWTSLAGTPSSWDMSCPVWCASPALGCRHPGSVTLSTMQGAWKV